MNISAPCAEEIWKRWLICSSNARCLAGYGGRSASRQACRCCHRSNGSLMHCCLPGSAISLQRARGDQRGCDLYSSWFVGLCGGSAMLEFFKDKRSSCSALLMKLRMKRGNSVPLPGRSATEGATAGTIGNESREARVGMMERERPAIWNRADSS
jgi:hypothetical protein